MGFVLVSLPEQPRNSSLNALLFLAVLFSGEYLAAEAGLVTSAVTRGSFQPKTRPRHHRNVCKEGQEPSRGDCCELRVSAWLVNKAVLVVQSHPESKAASPLPPASLCGVFLHQHTMAARVADTSPRPHGHHQVL